MILLGQSFQAIQRFGVDISNVYRFHTDIIMLPNGPCHHNRPPTT